MPNLEVKARLPDFSSALAVAKSLEARALPLVRQIDTFFGTRKGRLKFRVIEQEGEATRGELIPYIRPDAESAAVSDYTLLSTEDPAAALRLLTQMLDVEVLVAKDRRVFLWKNVRIHLDRIDDLGDFFELEAVFSSNDPSLNEIREEREKVQYLLGGFGLTSEDMVSESNREMALRTLNARPREEPVSVVFENSPPSNVRPD